MFGSQAPTIEMNTSNIGSPAVRVIGVSSQQAPTEPTESTQQQSDEGATASNVESTENGYA